VNSYLEQIENAAEVILARDPDPVVRVRLLRDVLMRDAEDPDYRKARAASLASKWVKQLEEAQCDDGSWGRFHTENTKIKSTFPTTEFAIARGVALGLDKTHPVFRNAIRYMANVLRGKARWSDGYERSPCFPLAVKVFTAAQLGKIDPWNAAMDDLWDTWIEILQRTFTHGVYDTEVEATVSKDLLGQSVAGSYVGLQSVYNVEFLGCRSERIPKKPQSAYSTWLWNLPRGLGYRDAPLSAVPEDSSYQQVKQWLSSLESAAMFASWRDLAGGAVEWLWIQRDDDGLWDFGSGRGRSPHFPLSESWRKKRNRQTDYSTRVLALLRRYTV
jgi:hypothetical protein